MPTARGAVEQYSLSTAYSTTALYTLQRSTLTLCDESRNHLFDGLGSVYRHVQARRAHHFTGTGTGSVLQVRARVTVAKSYALCR